MNGMLHNYNMQILYMNLITKSLRHATLPDLLTGDLPVVVLMTHNAPRAARLTPSSLLPNVASCRTVKQRLK